MKYASGRDRSRPVSIHSRETPASSACMRRSFQDCVAGSVTSPAFTATVWLTDQIDQLTALAVRKSSAAERA
jgi:hypothetical protein